MAPRIHKTIFLALLGVMLVFGIALSGCSKNEAQTESGVVQTSARNLVTPDYRGDTIEQAQNHYAQVGFTGQVTTQYNGNCSQANMSGQVYQQDPLPNTASKLSGNLFLYHGCFSLKTNSANTNSGISAGGLISPFGISNFKAYENMRFTVTPDTGMIAEVVADWTTTMSAIHANLYGFDNVISDHTVEIQFWDGNSTVNSSTNNYTITSSIQSGNCSISPSGSVSVSENDDQTFSITVNSGLLALLEVDNNAVDCGARGCDYSFTNVTSDHSIKVTCQ